MDDGPEGIGYVWVVSITCPRALFSVVMGATLCGCAAPPTGFGAAQARDDGRQLLLGPEVSCTGPVDGFDRLVPEASSRGLDLPPADHSLPPGATDQPSIVARDLDLDGDVDLLVGGFGPTGLALLANSGAGEFELQGSDALPAPEWLDSWGGPPQGEPVDTPIGRLAAVDLDGDRLPEILILGPSVLWVARNLGGLRFSVPQVVLEGPPRGPVWLDVDWGDLDQDGELDLVIASGGMPDSIDASGTATVGSPDLVVFSEGDAWSVVAEVSPDPEQPAVTQLALITDLDRDGLPEVLLGPDFPDASDGNRLALYRNGGVTPGAVDLFDVAPSLGLDLAAATMGIDLADLDEDGRLDLCVTDLGPIRCMLGDPSGIYRAGAASLGLTQPAGTSAAWSGWSIELVDLDNDGLRDAAVAAGWPSTGWGESEPQLDGLWQGAGGGTFVDRSSEVGFADPTDHYGMAAADLDGDGFSELVLVGRGQPIAAWWNRCGSGAWLAVRARGPGAMAEGYGVQVEITADGRRRTRQILGARSLGQGPAEVRFGLGDAEIVERMVVYWPDGTSTELFDVPVDRVVTALHPDLGS